MEITLAEPTYVDKLLEEEGVSNYLQINRNSAEQEATSLLEYIKEYDANIAKFDSNLPPVIIVRLSKAVVYIVVLDRGRVLTGTLSVKIVEGLLPYLEKIKEAKRKAVLIFYSRRGKLTLASYLYLGSVIENHEIGILFVNGDPDEILEILWHLENIGKYEVGEDEIVRI
jgi:hypothetical protein